MRRGGKLFGCGLLKKTGIEPCRACEMPIDYSVGRFAAFGSGPDGPTVAWVEDGYVSSTLGTWEFRIDGEKVYGPRGDLVGYLKDGVATGSGSGQFLFGLQLD